MGPIVWAPLSEQYGRRRLSIGTFAMFTLFTLACALAPHWVSFIIFRLFSGIFASAPIALVPGIIADIYNEPRKRGRSMGVFMAVSISPFPSFTLTHTNHPPFFFHHRQQSSAL